MACRPSIPNCTPEAVQNPPAEYVVVEYRQEGRSTVGAAADVSGTPKFDEIRQNVKAAAVRVPDACLEDAGPTAVATAVPSLSLKPACEPWIVEIERALSGAGLRVFSWDTVIQLEREKSLTTAAAAKQLGADIVFVFSRLEVSDMQEAPATEEFRYLAADQSGNVFGPKTLDAFSRGGFEQFIAHMVGRRGEAETRVSSVIDAAALLPSTGENVWFFRLAETAPRAPKGLSFLFGRYGNGRWSLVRPDASTFAPKAVLSARDIWTGGARPAVGTDPDTLEAVRLRLIDRSAHELVRTFEGGK